MDELAIRVEDVSKVYRLYNRPSERLFDALGLAGKGRFKEDTFFKRVIHPFLPKIICRFDSGNG